MRRGFAVAAALLRSISSPILCAICPALAHLYGVRCHVVHAQITPTFPLCTRTADGDITLDGWLALWWSGGAARRHTVGMRSHCVDGAEGVWRTNQ